jgi:hypothetical protein
MSRMGSVAREVLSKGMFLKSRVTERQTEVYTLEWKDIDLQGSLISGASSGGAIGASL